MPGDDHDDKPHLAAAEAGRVVHIVTRDRAGGFPVAALAALGIQVQDPDGYHAALADAFPEDRIRVVEQMVERRQRREPDVTLELLLDRWSHGPGLAHFCARLELSS